MDPSFRKERRKRSKYAQVPMREGDWRNICLEMAHVLQKNVRRGWRHLSDQIFFFKKSKNRKIFEKN